METLPRRKAEGILLPKKGKSQSIQNLTRDFCSLQGEGEAVSHLPSAGGRGGCHFEWAKQTAKRKSAPSNAGHKGGGTARTLEREKQRFGGRGMIISKTASDLNLRRRRRKGERKRAAREFEGDQPRKRVL